MWNFLDDLLNIGEIVDTLVSLDEAVTRFNAVRQIKPNEEQLGFIQNFVNGNRKTK
jgi:hypothetical protein